MRLFTSITLMALCLFLTQMRAQDTGRFQRDIQFEEDDYNVTRTLYYYIPEDYDASRAYKLVVGMRGGPHSNAGQFRDQLTFLADSINAIIMCPENIAHFNVEEGLVKQLYRYSLDTTMSMYNIDPEYIYLTGLSFGGRHSVIVSMDTDDGDIPKLRGVIPFATGRNGQLAPNYDAIDQFAPACICIGESDAQIFKDVADDLFADITSKGGKALLNSIPNVGHTVAFATYPDEMMECINWIEDNQVVSNTASVLKEVNSITVSPNPVGGQLSWKTNLTTIEEVQIFDGVGQLMMKFDDNLGTIDVSALPRGHYILSIVSGDITLHQQFIKL